MESIQTRVKYVADVDHEIVIFDDEWGTLTCNFHYGTQQMDYTARIQRLYNDEEDLERVIGHITRKSLIPKDSVMLYHQNMTPMNTSWLTVRNDGTVRIYGAVPEGTYEGSELTFIPTPAIDDLSDNAHSYNWEDVEGLTFRNDFSDFRDNRIVVPDVDMHGRDEIRVTVRFGPWKDVRNRNQEHIQGTKILLFNKYDLPTSESTDVHVVADVISTIFKKEWATWVVVLKGIFEFAAETVIIIAVGALIGVMISALMDMISMIRGMLGLSELAIEEMELVDIADNAWRYAERDALADLLNDGMSGARSDVNAANESAMQIASAQARGAMQGSEWSDYAQALQRQFLEGLYRPTSPSSFVWLQDNPIAQLDAWNEWLERDAMTRVGNPASLQRAVQPPPVVNPPPAPIAPPDPLPPVRFDGYQDEAMVNRMFRNATEAEMAAYRQAWIDGEERFRAFAQETFTRWDVTFRGQEMTEETLTKIRNTFDGWWRSWMDAIQHEGDMAIYAMPRYFNAYTQYVMRVNSIFETWTAMLNNFNASFPGFAQFINMLPAF